MSRKIKLHLVKGAAISRDHRFHCLGARRRDEVALGQRRLRDEDRVGLHPLAHHAGHASTASADRIVDPSDQHVRGGDLRRSLRTESLFLRYITASA